MLVNRQGDRDFVKVLDFGLAKVVAETPEFEGGDPGQALTKAGTIAGTPKYMAPEQCVGGQIDGRTDLYALGLILYEMLTGVHPFAGGSIVAIIRHQLTTPIPPMKKVAPAVHVPASLEAIVIRLLDKLAERRYPSATELLAALSDVAESEELLFPEPSGRVQAGAPSPPPVSAAKSAIEVASSAELKKGEGTKAELPRVEAAAPEPSPAQPTTPAPAASPAAPEPTDPLESIRLSAKRVLARVQPVVMRLPPSLRRPIVLLAPALLLGILLVLLFRSGPEGEAGSRSAKRATRSHGPLQSAPSAQYEQAVANGAQALTDLSRQFPEDARVLRALAHTAMAHNEGLEAMRWFGKAAALDSQIVKEGEIVQAMMMMPSSREAVEEAIALLENELGATGVDALYTLAVRPGPARVKARFGQSLAKVSVRAHASAAAAVAIELHAANTCEAKKALLPRAAEAGDGRTLTQLRGLLDTHNCGPYGIVDCWPCLRQDAALQGAISALEARSGQKR